MELRNNDLVTGASGRFGPLLVFRQRGGKTFIMKRPGKRRKPASNSQRKQQSIFGEAVFYARSVLADQNKRAVYQSKLERSQSVYLLAISDFCKGPEICRWDLSDYAGRRGDRIIARVVDNVHVEWVKIEINDLENRLIEEGFAAKSANGADWVYKLTTRNTGFLHTKVVITAADMPGNIARQEIDAQAVQKERDPWISFFSRIRRLIKNTTL